MEESTCHEMVSSIAKISQYVMGVLYFFISFKYDFHVEAERMIVKT